MAKTILYDGTGLPHARRYAPRPEPEAVVSTVEAFSEAPVIEVTLGEVSPEFIALATGLPVDEVVDLVDGAGEPDETAPQDSQEPEEQANTDAPGEPPADDATSPQSGASVTEDAGAATLAALGL